MADWRQIQARIRKAKTSVNPSAKLSELYLRTRDAMVAWELGAFEEKNGRIDEAAKWYATAAQRFRRSEWKKKAEEALARLGVPATPVPAAAPPETTSSEGPSSDAGMPIESSEEPAGDLSAEAEALAQSREDYLAPEPPPLAVGEISEPEAETSRESASESEPQPGAAAQLAGHKKRRRGRRGGRGRRRKGSAASAASPVPVRTASGPAPAPDASAAPAQAPPSRRAVDETVAFPVSSQAEERRPCAPDARARGERDAEIEGPAQSRAVRPEHAAPQLPSERAAHGRAGDPALASRMAQLESMLRRLLAGRLHRLDELDDAPAGPGVFLLSDSDQVTSYYVECCQTLRIGLNNLTRSGRSGKTHHTGGRTYAEVDIKGKFADHLGISLSKVAQYMKDHCVVRWIQLDEDAPHLAHFAIGVLRTPLNLE
jgi:hypothetical protein